MILVAGALINAAADEWLNSLLNLTMFAGVLACLRVERDLAATRLQHARVLDEVARVDALIAAQKDLAAETVCASDKALAERSLTGERLH